MKKIILLSYPRSGNTLTRYLIEYFTGWDTLVYKNWMEHQVTVMDKPIRFFASKMNKVQEGIVYRASMGSFNSEFEHNIIHLKDKMPLMFVIRDYKEAVIRHVGASISSIQANIGILDAINHIENYMGNVELYHNWQNAKIMIRYEDLIDDEKIESVINVICKFFDIKNKRKVTSFMKNIQKYRDDALSCYRPGSQTLGKINVFHQKKVSEKDWKMIDKQIKIEYPHLIQYL